MSWSLSLVVQSTAEAMRVPDIAPHLRTWKGMRRASEDGRSWTFEGATVSLSYEARMGGEGLFNTVRVVAIKPTEVALGRLFELGQWLSSELGWPLTDLSG